MNIDDRYSPFSLSHPASSFPHLIPCTSESTRTKANEVYIPVSSDIYALSSVVVEGRTHMVLFLVDVHSIGYASDPIFGFKCGWYEPLHTNISVLFLSTSANQSPLSCNYI